MVNFTLRAATAQAQLKDIPFHEWRFPDGSVWTQFYRSGTDYLLRFPELADFSISADGHKIHCTPAPDTGNETSHHLYLNQVLPLALSKQGKLIFHASAVDIDGAAVAFVGESGRGKSTLAASFSTNEHHFLTDDGLRVEASGGDYLVAPSHCSIRLWQDSASALIAPGTATSPALEFTSKSRFLAGESIGFCHSPRPLRRAYLLGDGSASAVSIKPIKPAEALIELLKHSFLLDVEQRQLLAGHFDELSRLASLPIYYRLDYPRRFAELPAVRREIIQHVTR
jgi:hypothetical protein